MASTNTAPKAVAGGSIVLRGNQLIWLPGSSTNIKTEPVDGDGRRTPMKIQLVNSSGGALRLPLTLGKNISLTATSASTVGPSCGPPQQARTLMINSKPEGRLFSPTASRFESVITTPSSALSSTTTGNSGADFSKQSGHTYGQAPSTFVLKGHYSLSAGTSKETNLFPFSPSVNRSLSSAATPMPNTSNRLQLSNININNQMARPAPLPDAVMKNQSLFASSSSLTSTLVNTNTAALQSYQHSASGTNTVGLTPKPWREIKAEPADPPWVIAQYQKQYHQQQQQQHALQPQHTAPSMFIDTVDMGGLPGTSSSSMFSVGANAMQTITFKEVSQFKNFKGLKKPCNCTRSMCLKLYCECFANGEFCKNCNCVNCKNVLTSEMDRSRAIRSCLERNPLAFQPKIGKGRADTDRLHNKGCNCKRSSCLKNYCECYEAKVACTEKCRCVSCRNTEGDRTCKTTFRSRLPDRLFSPYPGTNFGSDSRRDDLLTAKLLQPRHQSSAAALNAAIGAGNSSAWRFLNDDVVQATALCLVAQADQMESAMLERPRSPLDDAAVQRAVLREFGTCLRQIIQSSVVS